MQLASVEKTNESVIFGNFGQPKTKWAPLFRVDHSVDESILEMNFLLTSFEFPRGHDWYQVSLTIEQYLIVRDRAFEADSPKTSSRL